MGAGPRRIYKGSGGWRLADAIPARVPGTVHTALLEHGDIPDPMVGRNDKLARENSYRVWWMKRRFSARLPGGEPTLIFEGVCYRARFWLNGTYLGEHSGMFGGPTYPVGHLLREENTLVVRIENAPADPMAYSEYADHDEGWKNGVVINASTAGITPASPPGASGIPCGWRAGRLSAWSGRLWRPGIRRRGWRTSACP